ncbi:MAG TPA: MFS transporter [bacterium]|nr:MFS transporter [bacterium]
MQQLKPVLDPYAALRNPNYRAYIVGRFVSEFGQQMLAVVVRWEIFDITHSALALGLVGLFFWIPIFLFILPAGSLADRYNRKHIVLLTQLLFAVCSVGLAFTSHFHPSIWLMYGLLFLSGVSMALSDPAKQALLPQLLPEKDFPNAMTWNSTVFQIASMAGPALGGFLIAFFNYPTVYLLDALCALIFFYFIWTLKYTQQTSSQIREKVSLQSLAAGLKFVWNTKIILATITMDLFVVLLGGAVALLPAFAKDILHVGKIALGFLSAAPAVGAFCMAALSVHLPPMKRAGLVLLCAVAGFGVATIVFGVSHWFWLSFLMMFLTGALDNISVIVRSTLVQVLTPDSMRGRVTAVSYIFIHSSNYLGAFESGAAAALFGLVPSVVFGGIGSILVVLAVYFIWPQVAQLGSLSDPMKNQLN